MTASGDGTGFRQGAGRLCLDFIRTLRYRGTPGEAEELADPADLASWVRQCVVCGAPNEVAPSGDALAAARALREGIRELIESAMSVSGLASCGAAAREVVNKAAVAPVPVPDLTASGELAWSAGDPLAAVFSMLARDALDLVTSEDVERVRPCADPHCGALFSDHSRPGTRRWCSMGTCGNRAKKNTLRHKVVAG